jgi:hypothetical protein
MTESPDPDLRAGECAFLMAGRYMLRRSISRAFAAVQKFFPLK